MHGTPIHAIASLQINELRNDFQITRNSENELFYSLPVSKRHAWCLISTPVFGFKRNSGVKPDIRCLADQPLHAVDSDGWVFAGLYESDYRKQQQSSVLRDFLPAYFCRIRIRGKAPARYIQSAINARQNCGRKYCQHNEQPCRRATPQARGDDQRKSANNLEPRQNQGCDVHPCVRQYLILVNIFRKTCRIKNFYVSGVNEYNAENQPQAVRPKRVNNPLFKPCLHY